MAVLVRHDRFGGGVRGWIVAGSDERLAAGAVAREGVRAAERLNLAERREVRGQLGELGPVHEAREEVGPALRSRGVLRVGVRDVDRHGLARARRRRAAPVPRS